MLLVFWFSIGCVIYNTKYRKGCIQSKINLVQSVNLL